MSMHLLPTPTIFRIVSSVYLSHSLRLMAFERSMFNAQRFRCWPFIMLNHLNIEECTQLISRTILWIAIDLSIKTNEFSTIKRYNGSMVHRRHCDVVFFLSMCGVSKMCPHLVISYFICSFYPFRFFVIHFMFFSLSPKRKQCPKKRAITTVIRLIFVWCQSIETI